MAQVLEMREGGAFRVRHVRGESSMIRHREKGSLEAGSRLDDSHHSSPTHGSSIGVREPDANLVHAYSPGPSVLES
eukprot:scaffold11187_cov30-Tisochrysis_lutea.AAC.11